MYIYIYIYIYKYIYIYIYIDRYIDRYIYKCVCVHVHMLLQCYRYRGNGTTGRWAMLSPVLSPYSSQASWAARVHHGYCDIDTQGIGASPNP